MFQFHWISITEFNGKNPNVPLHINLSHWPALEREPGRGCCSSGTPRPGVLALALRPSPANLSQIGLSLKTSELQPGWLRIEIHFMNLEKVKVLYKNLWNFCFSQNSKLFLNCKAFLHSCRINCGSLWFTHSPIVLKERNDGIRYYTKRTLVTYN